MKRVKAEDIALAKAVRKARIENGVSQVWMAEQLGVSSQQLHKYEVGVDRIPATYLKKISDALKVDIYEFFYDDDNDKQRGDV